MTEGALARNLMEDTSIVYFHFIEKKTPQQQAFIWGELSGRILFFKNLIYKNPSSKSSSNCKIEIFVIFFFISYNVYFWRFTSMPCFKDLLPSLPTAHIPSNSLHSMHEVRTQAVFQSVIDSVQKNYLKTKIMPKS